MVHFFWKQLGRSLSAAKESNTLFFPVEDTPPIQLYFIKLEINSKGYPVKYVLPSNLAQPQQQRFSLVLDEVMAAIVKQSFKHHLEPGLTYILPLWVDNGSECLNSAVCLQKTRDILANYALFTFTDGTAMTGKFFFLDNFFISSVR